MAHAEQVAERIQTYLHDVRAMSLTTINPDGGSHSRAMDFVVAPNLAALYFRMPATRVHAHNIERDPKVDGTMIRHHEMTERPVEGLSFLGRAALLGAGEEQNQAAELFATKFGSAAMELIERAAKPGDFQFYSVDVDAWCLYSAFLGEGDKPQTYVFEPPQAGDVVPA